MQSGDAAMGSLEKEKRWSGRELCSEFGFSLDALHYFEKRGLISPQRQAGTAVYGPKDRLNIQIILKGRKLGFTLDEIAKLLSAARSSRP